MIWHLAQCVLSPWVMTLCAGCELLESRIHAYKRHGLSSLLSNRVSLHCTCAGVIALAQSFKVSSFFLRFCTSPRVSDSMKTSVCSYPAALSRVYLIVLHHWSTSVISYVTFCIICCNITQYYTFIPKIADFFFIYFLIESCIKPSYCCLV